MSASITVTATPDPVTVGGEYVIEICGTGGRTVDFHIVAPDGSDTTGQFHTGSECGSLPARTADQAGTYTITVTNKNGNHVYASTTLTAS